MKAVVKKAAEEKTHPFPKLMISDKGRIVLMLNAQGRGVALTKTSTSPIGDPAGFSPMDCWSMESFRDFEGTITLSND